MKSYVIADLQQEPDESFFDRLRALIHHEVDFIQLRARPVDDMALLNVARRCRRLTLGSETKLLVNKRADIAASAEADGTHLPSDGLPAAAIRELWPELLLGRSCHSLDECRSAAEEKIDYILFGPVFNPRSKKGSEPRGLEELRRASSFGIPPFALGGISIENLSELRGYRLEGIAAVTMFMKDVPVAQVVEAVRAL